MLEAKTPPKMGPPPLREILDQALHGGGRAPGMPPRSANAIVVHKIHLRVFFWHMNIAKAYEESVKKLSPNFVHVRQQQEQ